MRRKEQNVSFYTGFSLVEMLMALFFGAFLLLLSSQLYIDFYKGHYAQRELSKLQQNTRQLLNYIKQNMEYLGYQGGNREGSNYDLFLFNNKAYYLSDPQCFIFFYDVNGDGCIGVKEYRNCRRGDKNMLSTIAKEFFGFRFKQGKLYLLDKLHRSCDKDSCNRWIYSCNDNSSWKEITQLIDYHIENMNFEWKKEGKVMEVKLTLRSEKERDLTYTESAYVYLLNASN